MSETEHKPALRQLIVRQRPAAHPELESLLQTLQQAYGLDAYTARQRLVGAGLALFGKGPPAQTGKIADLLQRHGFACWLIAPQRPEFAPARLRSLEIRAQEILLETVEGTLNMVRGAPAVGVLADLSGQLVDKHVKRLLAQNTYRGRDGLVVLSRGEMMRAILQGQPVFDLYLLDHQGEITAAARVLPGRFNVDGLGGRATMSSRQNLQAMVELVEEYAEPFRLHCDFGLSQLPKCSLRRSDESPSALLENLDSLTRYGWLVARLRGAGRPAERSRSTDQATVTAAATGAVIGQPALGAALGGSVDHGLPGLDEAAAEINAALADSPPEPSTEDVEGGRRDLPPPPDRPEGARAWKGSVLATGGTVIALVLGFEAGGDQLFRLLFRNSLAAGTVFALQAVGLFWGGFYFIMLKRRVENTPTSRIRSIAMGMVEVHGRARRQYALVAPMTQAACAWYRLRKYRKDSRDRWKMVREIDSNHVPFQVEDDTGRVTVDPQRASVKAKVRQTGYPGQSPLTFTAFGSSNDEDEKWVEDLIYEGTSLYVLGYAQSQRQERPSLKERTLAHLRQLKLDPDTLARYDADGDGRIDDREWEVARSDAEQSALREHLAATGIRKRQEEHVVIAHPPQRGLPFIIAETVSEADLVRKYQWRSLPLLLGGLVALAVALYKFLQYFGF